MRVIRHLARRTERLPGSVLTLGNFDGAHLGHQAIVRPAVARVREAAGLAVALTFEPHPVAVLAPGRAPLMLQTLHDRLASLAGLGIDVTVVQRFTRAFAALDPEAFVRDFLLRHVELAHVVVGYNVNFRRDRAADDRGPSARLQRGPLAALAGGQADRAPARRGGVQRARGAAGRDRARRRAGAAGAGRGVVNGARRGAGGGAGAPARAPMGGAARPSGAGGALEGRGGPPAGPSPGLRLHASMARRVDLVVPARAAG